MMKSFKVLLPALFSFALVLFAGCGGGDSDDGISADNHDFGSNDQNLYLCFGDSITAGNYLPSGERYPDRLSSELGKPVAVDAVPGSGTSDGLDRIHHALDSVRPGFVVILYGVNDVIMGYSESLIEYNLRNIIQACIDNQSIPVICTYCTPLYGVHRLFSSGVDELNDLIKSIASNMGVKVADFGGEISWTEDLYTMPDGLHPNSYGQQLMAQVLFETLN
jgi:acyl-CoA thioesterase-1